MGIRGLIGEKFKSSIKEATFDDNWTAAFNIRTAKQNGARLIITHSDGTTQTLTFKSGGKVIIEEGFFRWDPKDQQ